MRPIRVAVITAAAGIAALGAAGPALAAQASPRTGAHAAADRVCTYKVTATHGVKTHSRPSGSAPTGTPLPKGTVFGGISQPNHWVKLHDRVPSGDVGYYSYRGPHFEWIRLVSCNGAGGGVGTGAGGTSVAPDHLKAGAGLGVIALGGGLAFVARRRRVAADV